MAHRLSGCYRWVPACLAILLTAACSAGAEVSYSPPFVPFTLTVHIDQHGHVSVSGSASAKIVTEVGQFSVGGGVSTDLAQQNQATVVDFRSGKADYDYMIHTGDELHFEASGHVVETITRNLVIITVSPRTAFRIAISGTPPPPAPRPDPNCRGVTHLVRLPVFNLGPGRKFDSVDAVRAKLRAICITSTVLRVIHGANYHEPSGEQYLGEYLFDQNGNWRPLPAGSVDEVDIPCDRHMFFIFWHNYNYISAYLGPDQDLFGAPGVTWVSCDRPKDAREPPGETDKPGTLAVVRSDKPAIIYFLDGT